MQNRIAELLQLQKEDPNDPFYLYALALEYERIHDYSRSLELLNSLINSYPNYSGTYLKLAQILVDVEKVEDAIVIINKGIELAKIQGNNKMKNELEQLLENID